MRGVARRLPEPIVDAIGATIGLAFYVVDWQHRRVALANLEQCFPNKPVHERRAIARGTFAHFGRVLLKLLTFSALTPEQMMACSDYEGDERVRLAYAKGKGVLFFTGHFGFWELHALAHAVKLRPIGVLARALDNPRLNDLLERVRTKTGNSVIYRQGAVRRVLKTLAAGEGVAMLIDQHMHSPDAIWVNFFRRPAATTSTLAALALRTGAAVIPVFAHAAARRALQVRLRIAGRAARWRRPRRDPRVHAALHRRARDARPQASGAVAVDASPLARRAAPRRRAGCFHAPRKKTTVPERIVVMAPNWLGDAVMALPAHCRSAPPLCRRAPHDRGAPGGGAAVHDGPGRRRGRHAAGRGGGAPATLTDARRLQAGGFDTALLLPNSFAAAMLAKHAGIPSVGDLPPTARPAADARVAQAPCLRATSPRTTRR